MRVPGPCADQACALDHAFRSDPFHWKFSPDILQIHMAVVLNDGDMFYFSI